MTDKAFDMTDSATPHADSARVAALNAALADTIRPPHTPAELRTGVLATIARERPIDEQACWRELEQLHRAAIAQLNRYYLRRCRDALLLGASLLAAVDLSIEPLSQRLAPFFADAAPLVAGCAVLAVGASCGAALLRQLFRPVAIQDLGR